MNFLSRGLKTAATMKDKILQMKNDQQNLMKSDSAGFETIMQDKAYSRLAEFDETTHFKKFQSWPKIPKCFNFDLNYIDDYESNDFEMIV